MSRKPQKKRREHKPDENGSLWLAAMCELLKGGALAGIIALLTLLIYALLVSNGIISERGMERSVLAACILGGVVGGMLAVRSIRRSTLLVGAGVGAILFLLLLSAGFLFFDTASISNGSISILLACLCGGAMAGILGAPRKKRKR